MSLLAFLETVLVGKKVTKDRESVRQAITDERIKLEESQKGLQADICQNQQIIRSANRVLQNMAHAMTLMEANGGRHKK